MAALEKVMLALYKVCEKLGGPVSLWTFVLDPNSFVATGRSRYTIFISSEKVFAQILILKFRTYFRPKTRIYFCIGNCQNRLGFKVF
jgi:hypothetical protein